MSLSRLAGLSTLAVIITTGNAADAQAQLMRRPISRMFPFNSPWAMAYGLGFRQQPTVIIPPTVTPGTPGTPGNPGLAGSSSSSQSSMVPASTVRIQIVLPVAGATIQVNGVDFGKTEYYERYLQVPEAPDGISHDYHVSATWQKDGKSVTQERTVKVGKTGRAQANFLVAP